MMTLRGFLFLFLLVFATRFGYFLHARPYRAEPNGSYGKMYEMEASADRIARDGRMADVFGEGSGPSAHVAPLYAFYLAAIDRLVGLDVGRFRFISGIGSILATSLFVALLPALASRARLRPGVGLAAGLLLAALALRPLAGDPRGLGNGLLAVGPCCPALGLDGPPGSGLG